MEVSNGLVCVCRGIDDRAMGWRSPTDLSISNRKLYINTHTATFLIIFSVLFGKKNFHLLD
jgi:hypothetical protein